MLRQPVRKPHSPAQSELLGRLLGKDEVAIRGVMQQYNRRLYRLARSIVRNDSEAEDVVQESYVRAFTSLASFRGESDLGTWLGRIVINEALGTLRRRRSVTGWARSESGFPFSAQVLPFPFSDEQPDPERSMAQREIQFVLERAIDDLPEAFRMVFVARLVEEMSIEETAALLGLRPETVKTRLHRARKLLTQALERHLGPTLTGAFPFEGRRCARMADAVIRRLDLPAA